MARPPKLPRGMQKRGDVYYAAFRKNGKLIRKRLSGDLSAAREMLNDLKARADKADFNLIDNDYPWSDARREFLQWAKQNTRPRVAAEYERDLDKFEAYCKLGSLRGVDAQYVYRFRAWRLADDISPRTINRQVSTLCNMLGKCVGWRRIGHNPLRELDPLPNDRPRKQRRAMSVAETIALFQHSPDYLRPVWRMFATTGIRRNELVNMRFADVDHERRCVTVQADTSKNHKPREVPLDDQMLAIIADLEAKAPFRQPLARGPKATVQKAQANFSQEHVFVTGANTPWRNNLLRSFYACCAAAGIEGAHAGGSVDVHALRPSFTTQALEHGASPKAIQAILGHSTLAMTMSVYAKATDRGKRDAVAALPFAQVTAPGHVVSLPNVRTTCATEKEASQTKVDQSVA